MYRIKLCEKCVHVLTVESHQVWRSVDVMCKLSPWYTTWCHTLWLSSFDWHIHYFWYPR